MLGGCSWFSSDDDDAPPESTQPRVVGVPTSLELAEDDRDALCAIAEQFVVLDLNSPDDQPEIKRLLDEAIELDIPAMNAHLQVFHDATVGTDFDQNEFDAMLARDPALSLALATLESFVVDTCEMATLFGGGPA